MARLSPAGWPFSVKRGASTMATTSAELVEYHNKEIAASSYTKAQGEYSYSVPLILSPAPSVPGR